MQDARRSALTTLLQLCDPRQASIDLPAGDQEWTRLTALAAAHGLQSLCHHRAVGIGVPLPESVRSEWHAAHLRDRLVESAALRQLEELRELLAAEGIPVMALKGASAAVRLYPAPGLRTMADLDVLIPADRVLHCTRIMRDTGYEELPAWTSAEDQLLDDGKHPMCMTKRGALLFEGHTDVLFGSGNSGLAAAEAWREAESDSGSGLLHLGREHFLIHSLLHWQKHLRTIGFSPLKGLVDVLYALSRWEIGWQRFWSTAKRWRVEEDLLPVTRAVSDLWALGLPLPRDFGRDAEIDRFLRSPWALRPDGRVVSSNPSHYVARMRQARALPTLRQRFRYLFRLCFPVAAHMRFRYDLPPGRRVWPYYARLVAGRMWGLAARLAGPSCPAAGSSRNQR